MNPQRKSKNETQSRKQAARARLRTQVDELMEDIGIESPTATDDILDLFQSYADTPDEYKDKIFNDGLDEIFRKLSMQSSSAHLPGLNLSRGRFTSLANLFVSQLASMYDAENRFLKVQGQMLRYTANVTLQLMIQQNLLQTEHQIRMLEKVHDLLEVQLTKMQNTTAIRLIQESLEIIQKTESDVLRDVIITLEMAKIEHYKFATYRGLVTIVQVMGIPRVEQILQRNLLEVEQTMSSIERIMMDVLIHVQRVQSSKNSSAS